MFVGKGVSISAWEGFPESYLHPTLPLVDRECPYIVSPPHTHAVLREEADKE